MLVLKGIFGGSFKITSEIEIIFEAKHSLKRFLGQRGTKSTRKRNTPENAGNGPFPESAFSGVLRFGVLFVPLKEGAKTHPKTQHTRKRRCFKRN